MIIVTKKFKLGVWTELDVTGVTLRESTFNGDEFKTIWITGKDSEGYTRSCKINATNEDNLGFQLSDICDQIDIQPPVCELEEMVAWLQLNLVEKKIKVIQVAVSIQDPATGIIQKFPTFKFNTELSVTPDMCTL